MMMCAQDVEGNQLHTRWVHSTQPGATVVQCWSCHRGTPNVNFCIFCGNFVLNRKFSEYEPELPHLAPPMPALMEDAPALAEVAGHLPEKVMPPSPAETTDSGDSETDGSSEEMMDIDMDLDHASDFMNMVKMPDGLGTCV